MKTDTKNFFESTKDERVEPQARKVWKMPKLKVLDTETMTHSVTSGNGSELGKYS